MQCQQAESKMLAVARWVDMGYVWYDKLNK